MQSPPRLRWMSTAARSGKLKNRTYDVPPDHVNSSHVSKTQRQYKVRFKSNTDSKRSKSRGGVAVRDFDFYEPSPGVRSSPGETIQSSHLETSSLLRLESMPAEFNSDVSFDDQDYRPQDINNLEFVDITSDTTSLEVAILESSTGDNDYFPRFSIYPGISPTSVWQKFESSRDDQRFYLQYYIERVVSRLMPLWATPDNPFICIVVPASLDSPILMNAITAISAYHHDINISQHSNIQQSGRRKSTTGVTALRYKQKVLSLLRENLAKPDVLQDPATLAACMLMQTFEVLCSGTSGWDHWLKGATLFVQMRGQLDIDLRSSNSWIRLIKSVVAVETFAATSADLDMVISSKYWEIYRRQRQESLDDLRLSNRVSDFGEDQHFEQLIGCPAWVVYALGQIVVKIRERRIAIEENTLSFKWLNVWNQETTKLEDLLLRWKPTNPDPDRVNLTESFRHAALVYYCHHVRSLPYTHSSLQFHVRKTFEHLLSLKSASQLEGIALWPTMIAAIDIDEQANNDLTETAIERIRLMASQKKDTLYQHAEEALNMLWGRRRNATCWDDRVAVNWEELSQEMGWKWCMV